MIKLAPNEVLGSTLDFSEHVCFDYDCIRINWVEYHKPECPLSNKAAIASHPLGSWFANQFRIWKRFAVFQTDTNGQLSGWGVIAG